MKIIAVLFAVLVAFAAAQGTTQPTIATVAVLAADRTCKVASDCRSVQTTCGFDCGTAVNADGSVRIAGELVKICPAGAITSQSLCPDTYVTCQAGNCVNAPVPGPVPVNQSLQTCKADSDCQVVQPSCKGTPCCSAGAVVGLSTSNSAAFAAAYAKLCVGVTQYDCSMVKCATIMTSPSCVEGYCTVNGAKPVLITPQPPTCDIALKSNEFCKCVTTATGASWVCPLTCPGVPPKGCRCTAVLDGPQTDISASTSLQYTCSADACVSATKPAGVTDTSKCYCGIKAGTVTQAATSTIAPVLTPEWICPVTPCCSDVVTVAKTAACSAADAKVWCDPATCQWQYTCPPPPTCSCDNIALPILKPTIDGCSTENANWYCATSIGVTSSGTVVSVNAAGSGTALPAPARKRQSSTTPIISDCARFEFKCNQTTQCVASYGCGYECYDASLPRPMIACMPPFDPVIICQQQCLQKYSKCIPNTDGSANTCRAVKSSDYDACAKTCASVPPPPTDKCTYLRDQCSCESNGCGWCASDVTVSDPIKLKEGQPAASSISVGFCASLNSQFQCVTQDKTFSTASTVSGGVAKPPCAIDILPQPIPLPVDPAVPVIDKCLLDGRCASTTDFNQVIKDIATSAPAGDVTKTFTIVITAVIKSDGGVINLGVDVLGDREPTTVEKPDICKVVSSSLAKTLKFDSSRMKSCALSKVSSTTVKRAAQGTTSSYVANIEVADAGNAANAAGLSALALFVAAALALVF